MLHVQLALLHRLLRVPLVVLHRMLLLLLSLLLLLLHVQLGWWCGMLR